MEPGGSFSSFQDFAGTSPEALLQVFNEIREFVSIHSVELDEFGDVVDAYLRGWNRAYETVRTNKVTAGQSMLDTYFQPRLALDFVNRAWHEGVAYQVFELPPVHWDKYRRQGTPVLITATWRRVGDYVMETGTDLSELRLQQLQLAAPESSSDATLRTRIRAEERERIAQDLHDSVVQQLFAATLELNVLADRMTGVWATNEYPTSVRRVAATLSDVMTEIRQGILQIHDGASSSLATDLTDTVELITHAAGVECAVRVADDVACDGEIRSNLRVVVREAVTNAVRHGQAGHIAVDVERVGLELVAKIADDGVGLPEDLAHSSGLANMHERAARLGGTMTALRGEHEGTVVTWCVPMSGRRRVDA